MMSFILPILKISSIVRDAFIEVLRKAMSSRQLIQLFIYSIKKILNFYFFYPFSNVKTCRMGVYGFCMILKQLNNSNSQRSQMGASGMCTQQSISGFSLMSQATLGNRNNPQRHFDMLTLEIIGLLRNCFTQNLEIKRTLYESMLYKCVIFYNCKLTHLLLVDFFIKKFTFQTYNVQLNLIRNLYHMFYNSLIGIFVPFSKFLLQKMMLRLMSNLKRLYVLSMIIKMRQKSLITLEG